ncbi:hypothetical protein N7449_005159 [Penicillium cf. viridicatum]|uniref:Uncharacterized protein n=1 Tax=Penicillium cf. viridicatum TaxID=2972119 RepID=A0A9W9MKW6_9EURO|nr:hypothetical protein N7449_005159 [Penicillium cf. viridicatum]
MSLSRPVKVHKVNYGWSLYSEGTESEYRSLIIQMRDYIARGYVTPTKTAILYSRFGATLAGIYIGNSLQSKDISDVALQSLIDDSYDFDRLWLYSSVDRTMTLSTSLDLWLWAIAPLELSSLPSNPGPMPSALTLNTARTSRLPSTLNHLCCLLLSPGIMP